MQIILFVPKNNSDLFHIGLKDDSKNHLGWFVNQVVNDKQKSDSYYFRNGIISSIYIDFVYHYPIDNYVDAEDYMLELAIRLSEELCCDVKIVDN